MDVTELVLGAWGAVLSSALAIREWTNTRPRIRIWFDAPQRAINYTDSGVAFEPMPEGHPEWGAHAEACLEVRIANGGAQPIRFDSPTLYADGRRITPPSPLAEFPVTIEPGHRIEVVWRLVDVAERVQLLGLRPIVNVTAEIRSQLGVRFVSDEMFPLRWETILAEA